MKRLLWLALTIAFLSYMPLLGARVVFTLHALELGANSFEVGLIVAGIQLPMLVLSIPMAQMAERFGAPAVLFVGQLLGSIALALPYFFPAMPALYAASLIAGLWSVMSFQPCQKLIGMLSAPHELAKNFSAFSFASGLAMLAGPFIAGVSVDWLGHARAGFSLLPFTLGGALILVLLGGRLPGVRGAGVAAPRVRETLADREVLRLLAISAILSAPFELYPYILPLYGHAAGLSASTIGSIVSLSAIGALVLPPALPYLVKRFGEERVLGGALCVIAFSFAVVPLSTSAVLLGMTALLFGFASNTNIPVTTILAYARLPEQRASQFLGLRNTAGGAVRGVSPPLFGALAALFGVPAVIFGTGALLAAGAAWVWRSRTDPGAPPRLRP